MPRSRSSSVHGRPVSLSPSNFAVLRHMQFVVDTVQHQESHTADRRLLEACFAHCKTEFGDLDGARQMRKNATMHRSTRRIDTPIPDYAPSPPSTFRVSGRMPALPFLSFADDDEDDTIRASARARPALFVPLVLYGASASSSAGSLRAASRSTPPPTLRAPTQLGGSPLALDQCGPFAFPVFPAGPAPGTPGGTLARLRAQGTLPRRAARGRQESGSSVETLDSLASSDVAAAPDSPPAKAGDAVDPLARV